MHVKILQDWETGGARKEETFFENPDLSHTCVFAKSSILTSLMLLVLLLMLSFFLIWDFSILALLQL